MILSTSEVVELNEKLIIATGGSHGIRDIGLLESAVMGCYQSFGGEDLYSTVVEKAARMAYTVCKNHHGKYPDSFISVNEGMVFYQRKSKMSRHCLNSRVQIMPIKCMIWRIDRLIQQMGIPYTVKTAASGDKHTMQSGYVFNGETNTGHFANALNAEICLLSISSPTAITSSFEAFVNLSMSFSTTGVKVIVTVPVGISGGTSIISL